MRVNQRSRWQLSPCIAATAVSALTCMLAAPPAAAAAGDPMHVPAIADAQAPPITARARSADDGVRGAGLGVNAGLVMLRLSADRAVRTFGGTSGTQLADEAPSTIASFDLHENMLELAPTVQLGGDRFYFKLEAPLRQSATLRSYGAGVYPLNYGYYIRALHVMPSVSMGGVFSYLKDRRTDAAGPLVETRVALGIKVFPTRGLALSADIARTPWALAAVRGSGPDWWKRADARGGLGDGWQFSLGVFWL
jgi:hypothetical protein